MSGLVLRSRLQSGSTLIDNTFIDKYMPTANGEYVKVYLLLLRHLNCPCPSLSIAQMADCLEHTEGDILRALKYWEKEGLLTLDCDSSGGIVGLEMGSAPLPQAADVPSAAMPEPECREPQPDRKESQPSHRELQQILFVAEQYLGKTLTRTDVDAITYFYDTLHFSADLIEYLIEYCVENGHKSIHYIQKVALAWADEHIETAEQARSTSAIYNRNCYSVLNAFGIKGRGPAAAELDYIRRWTDDAKFDLDLILEACSRTIHATHQPSFEYTDKILQNWQKNQVRTLADVHTLDEARKKAAPAAPKPGRSSSASGTPNASSKFRNFEEHSYDMDELTKQLLHSN